jgi:AhpD family alkylhydroperoxidase
MTSRLGEFKNYRTRMNERVAEIDHLGIKRFYNLDTNAYKDGALDGKTKELLGLVASVALRCNDCIDYHIIQCVEAGWTDDELYDAFNVALVVGGSIGIPHFRHAVESLDLYRGEKAK